VRGAGSTPARRPLAAWLACAFALAAGLAIAWSGVGPGLHVPPAIALIGGLLGALVRRSSNPRREMP
jgi:hypothetical protein